MNHTSLPGTLLVQTLIIWHPRKVPPQDVKSQVVGVGEDWEKGTKPV